MIFIKLTNIDINKKQISILALVTAIAIVMTVSPVGMNFSNNIAFAGGKDYDDDDDDDGNSASQIIAQVQRSIQNSQVVSGGDTEDSGNNFNFQNQENEGNNALVRVLTTMTMMVIVHHKQLFNLNHQDRTAK